MNCRNGVLCLTAMLWAGAAWAQGPVSPYFLTAGDQQSIHRLTGTSLFSWTAGDGGEYPIAVFADTGSLRTSGFGGGGQGREYDFAGNVIGGPYTLSGIGSAWDATTDGSFLYMVDYTNGNVVRTNLDYTGATVLFGGLGSSAFLGSTYDPTNNSLWISGWINNQVRNYTLDGTLLSSFNAGAAANSLTSLALDYATDTLWMGTQNAFGQFFEYSKTGTLLQTVNIGGLSGQNTLGGEFAFTAVPEPTTLVLCGLGLCGVIGADWKRRKQKRSRAKMARAVALQG